MNIPSSLSRLILLPLVAVTLSGDQARVAHASSPDSTGSPHKNVKLIAIGVPVPILPSDSVAASVTWTATGGTITPSGLYTASQAGIYKVVASTSDGRLADTATVIVMSPLTTAPGSDLGAESFSGPASVASNRPISVEVGAPAITMNCKDSADFIRIDRGWLIMLAGSKRQIKVGGCYHGRPIAAVSYAYASHGVLTPEMRYESDGLPGIIRIEVGSSELPARARARLVVIPTPLQWGVLWGILVGLRRLWRDRKRRRGPPTESLSVANGKESFIQAWSSASTRTFGRFKALQRGHAGMGLCALRAPPAATG